MGWDPRSAGNYAKAQAEPGPTSNCAAYVRQAIHAGGINVINTHHAKDYGPMLEAAGFRKISSTQSPRRERFGTYGDLRRAGLVF